MTFWSHMIESIENQTFNNSSESLMQSIAINPYTEIEYDEARECLFRVMQTLKPQQRDVLYKRFFGGMTLREVGCNCSLSMERIRQIEAKALRILRHPSRMKFLKYFLELVQNPQTKENQ